MSDKPDEDAVLDAEVVENPTPAVPAGDYDERGVPSFDHVRDRIEGRFATSVGSTELAGESAAGRSIDEQLAERERAGNERLEQIRRSMRGDG